MNVRVHDRKLVEALSTSLVHLLVHFIRAPRHLLHSIGNMYRCMVSFGDLKHQPLVTKMIVKLGGNILKL